MSRQSGGRPEVGFESSWYHATRNDQADRATLTEDLDCDVCVIGGGYTGLSAALTLSEAGFKVVLLEQYRIGSGASGRNGGVLGIGQRKDQEDLERMVDPAWARQLLSLIHISEPTRPY